jgi:hypothetical protein
MTVQSAAPKFFTNFTVGEEKVSMAVVGPIYSCSKKQTKTNKMLYACCVGSSLPR